MNPGIADQGQFELGFYQNTHQLNALTHHPGLTDRQALEQVANQFESLFLQTILKEARKSTVMLNEDNPFSSRETQFYQEMLDNQMASHIGQNNGLGIADMIVKQMAQYVDSEPKALKSGVDNG